MTARVRRPGRVFMKRAEAMPQSDDFHQRIRALEALPPGQFVYAIELFEVDEPVTTVSEKFELLATEDLQDAELVKVEIYVNVAASAGTVQVQLVKELEAGGEVDMLSTPISIDAGELNSKTASVAYAIDTANSTVAWGDHVHVEILNGADAVGLGLVAWFLPGQESRITIRGLQGPPGGVNVWTGEWDPGTTYSTGDSVSHNGSSYVAIQPSTNVEPGVTPGWEDFWQILSAAKATSALQFTINGNGRVIDVGRKQPMEVPFDCTIDEVVMLADFAGNAVVDVWKTNFAGYSGITSGDSITAASPPTIVADDQSLDTVLSGWDTSLLQGDILVFNVVSCSLITLMTISLKVLR